MFDGAGIVESTGARRDGIGRVVAVLHPPHFLGGEFAGAADPDHQSSPVVAVAICPLVVVIIPGEITRGPGQLMVRLRVRGEGATNIYE